MRGLGLRLRLGSEVSIRTFSYDFFGMNLALFVQLYTSFLIKMAEGHDGSLHTAYSQTGVNGLNVIFGHFYVLNIHITE